VLFVSQNVANAGNLAYNVLFSRLMGPALFADLATLLTLKLSLMSVFGAVQFAVGKSVATGRAVASSATSAAARLHRTAFVILALLLTILAPLVLILPVAEALGLGGNFGLPILLLALPVTAPLCIARGLAQGRMRLAPLVLSVNIEMAVRLGVGYAMWQTGFGIEGVAAAIALSLAAGWLPVRAEPTADETEVPEANQTRTAVAGLAAATLPFAVLQAAQVAHLDGDVLLANALLDEITAGNAAVLSLVQRIQFFACVGLALALLPAVAAATSEGRCVLRAAQPVALIFGGVSATVLTGVVLWPEAIVELLSGQAYTGAADALLPACLAAVCFTFSYLAATFLSALDLRAGILAIAAFVPVQAGALWGASRAAGPEVLGEIYSAKAVTQAALAAVLGLLLLRALPQARASGGIPARS
jgi:O-antigen/teichoic acid export membrane protein